MRAALLPSGKYGRGNLSCRRPNRAGWSAPTAVRMEGGRASFLAGGSESDLAVLVMNKPDADKHHSSTLILGAEGPVARIATIPARVEDALHSTRAAIEERTSPAALFSGLPSSAALARIRSARWL
jgi:lipid-binding SYLF domain-containing protein